MPRDPGPPTREQMLLVQGVYERYRAMIYKFAKASFGSTMASTGIA